MTTDTEHATDFLGGFLVRAVGDAVDQMILDAVQDHFAESNDEIMAVHLTELPGAQVTHVAIDSERAGGREAVAFHLENKALAARLARALDAPTWAYAFENEVGSEFVAPYDAHGEPAPVQLAAWQDFAKTLGLDPVKDAKVLFAELPLGRLAASLGVDREALVEGAGDETRSYALGSPGDEGFLGGSSPVDSLVLEGDIAWTSFDDLVTPVDGSPTEALERELSEAFRKLTEVILPFTRVEVNLRVPTPEEQQATLAQLEVDESTREFVDAGGLFVPIELQLQSGVDPSGAPLVLTRLLDIPAPSEHLPLQRSQLLIAVRDLLLSASEQLLERVSGVLEDVDLDVFQAPPPPAPPKKRGVRAAVAKAKKAIAKRTTRKKHTRPAAKATKATKGAAKKAKASKKSKTSRAASKPGKKAKMKPAKARPTRRPRR